MKIKNQGFEILSSSFEFCENGRFANTLSLSQPCFANCFLLVSGQIEIIDSTGLFSDLCPIIKNTKLIGFSGGWKMVDIDPEMLAKIWNEICEIFDEKLGEHRDSENRHFEDSRYD